ncbi:MAG: dihydrolipoamide dehydrogenase [Alphaproteobacteria bacterium]|nr:dihydrolipoamide dehydrogenase [Alphaproteobacteria bacterium]
MTERLDVDLCVIGGGSAGLSLAAGASQLGLKVVLCEAGRMGGDCLNSGCVPSKALIAAAGAAHAVRTAERFGVHLRTPAVVDYAGVRAHVRRTIEAIAPNDSVARFTGLGVRVIEARARFVSPDAVEAGNFYISARKFAIATGSRPAIPPIPGLDDVGYLTNETVFDLDARPDHLLVVGGGAIGCELAQAHARLGTRVTLVEAGEILPREDREAAAVVRRALLADGVTLHESTKVVRFEKHEVAPVAIVADAGGGETPIAFSHVLIATGRAPNVEDLGLDKAGVDYGPRGIAVDRRLFTANRRIVALGDVSGAPQFTHVAGWHAGIAIRNLCFRMPVAADTRAIPHVTYTAPELAQVGPTEEELRAGGISPRAVRWAFAENDRAQATGETEGFVKLLANTKGRILAATIVGAHAGDLLAPWISAVSRRAKLSEMAGLTMPYPTLSEAGKRAAGSYFAPQLFSPRTRKLVRFLFRLPF